MQNKRKRGYRDLTIQELFIVNLKAYRKIRGFSQMNLADLCDTSYGYIGEIEAGKRFPSVNMIERIAGALGIESWHLFMNEPLASSSPDGAKKLAPTEKNKILKRANKALAKILDNY